MSQSDTHKDRRKTNSPPKNKIRMMNIEGILLFSLGLWFVSQVAIIIANSFLSLWRRFCELAIQSIINKTAFTSSFNKPTRSLYS